MTKNLERKKKYREEQIGEGPIFDPTIQLVVINVNTRFEVSILNGCGDIFDEKFRKKEKGTNKRKNKYEKANFRSHDTTCILNMKFLSLMVVEISLTKNLERKKMEQTKGRTNRRMPICNPTIQVVVVDLYTIYEVSILNGCGDIFDEKVLRNYGRRDGRTDYPITLEGRRGTTEFATIPYYLVLFSAALVELAKSIPVHSLILFSHLFFCLPLFLFPFTMPCRIVFAKPEDLEPWPNHLSFRFLTRVRSSSYHLMETVTT